MVWIDDRGWVEERYNKLKKELLLAKLCKFFTWIVGGLLTILAGFAGYKLYIAFTTIHIIFAAIVSILEIVSFSLIISLYRVNNRLVAIFERQIPNYKELLDEWKNRKVN